MSETAAALMPVSVPANDDMPARNGLSCSAGMQASESFDSRGVVLVADPEPRHVQQLASGLDRYGWSVKVAPCPKKLCSSFESDGVRGIVLELYSDGEEHLDYLRLVRQRYPVARIIVATAYPSFRSAVSAMRLGADDYAAKPIAAAELTQMLDERYQEMAELAQLPSLHRMEWEYINRVLRHTGGNISAAARLLGVERSTLQRKLRKHPPER